MKLMGKRKEASRSLQFSSVQSLIGKNSGISVSITDDGVSLVVHWQRICLRMQEKWVSSLGQKDPLEKEMATHSSILTREIPWTEDPGGLQFIGSEKAGHDLAAKQQQSLRIKFVSPRNEVRRDTHEDECVIFLPELLKFLIVI